MATPNREVNMPITSSLPFMAMPVVGVIMPPSSPFAHRCVSFVSLSGSTTAAVATTTAAPFVLP